MTQQERENIFSKEVLTIDDISTLFACSYQEAAKIIRQIRHKFDRLHVQGRVHIQDYLDYFQIDSLERYNCRKKALKETEEEETNKEVHDDEMWDSESTDYGNL